MRLVQGGGAASLQLIQALSDSEEEHDSAWDGRLGDRYNPPVDATPDTRELEYNEIKTQVGLATGQLGLHRTAQQQSFPRMLHQVGFSASSQPGSRPVEASSSASP